MSVKQKWMVSCEKFLTGVAILLIAVYFWQEKGLLYDILGYLELGCLWMQETFSHIVNPDEDWVLWMPTAVCIAIPVLGMILFPEPSRLSRYIIVAVMALLHTFYILFRTFYTLRFTDVGSGIATILLWFSEALLYLCSLSLYIQLMFSVDRKGMADLYEKTILSGDYQPSVDVFITAFSEPLEMIRRTTVGCQALDYSKKRVYILDDGNRADIKTLSEELGCDYITRPHNAYAKAGNVNHALMKTDSELIALFDADCIPVKNFLSRTVGFFQEKDVGLVSSAQTFYNGDMYKHNIMSLLEQSNFFRHTQSGRDRFNALLCFGTCFVIKRQAIEKVGGIPVETLSEDWATSIKIQAAGYKTYMLNEALGAGAVAESMGEFIQQRVRWAQGTLQSLFCSTNPFRIKGLSFLQRVIHSYGIMHYLINPFLILIIILPLFYFFFGFSPFYPSRGGFWIFFVPFFCFNALGISWICREITSKLSALIAETFMSVPLSIATLKTLIKPFGWRFRVTRKGIYRSTAVMNWILGVPLLFFLILSIVGVVYGYHTRFWRASEELFFFLFIITAMRMVFLWVGLYASHDFPQQRKAMRFSHCLDCSFAGDIMIKGETADISESGILMKSSTNIERLNKNKRGILSLNEIGIYGVPARLVRIQQGSDIAIIFEEMPLATYRRLIEFLYCRPEQWEHSSNLDIKVARAFKNAVSWDKILKNRPLAAKRGK